ncbi:hypothetical protein NDN08_005266 [Rhodosorus marinus]|uniref:Uncharacterized protein n=1 Tax=Rhodosorus marinus TaxID=101924 RepID=A0AAV8V551_9RHOD|nr:hypothetical protein NDN08_005266 [Rhodosorus marinus]
MGNMCCGGEEEDFAPPHQASAQHPGKLHVDYVGEGHRLGAENGAAGVAGDTPEDMRERRLQAAEERQKQMQNRGIPNTRQGAQSYPAPQKTHDGGIDHQDWLN